MTDGTIQVDDDVSPLWRALAQSPTSAGPWRALAQRYAAAGMPWQAAYTERQSRRLDPGGAPPRGFATSRAAPWEGPVDDAALGLDVFAEGAALDARFTDWLKSHPGDWLTWLYAARLREMGGSAPVEDALAKARASEPIPGESLHWMGVWRLNAGDAQGAIEALSGLLDIRPVRCGSMMYLGEALLQVGKIAAAEKAFARASLSHSPDFLLLLANRVHACNYWSEAIEVLQKAISIKPDSVPAWLALARIQSDVYALTACRESLRRLRALDPDHAEARLLEAGLRGRCGDAEGHLATLQALHAANRDPGSRLASSIAMTALYVDDLTPQEVSDLHRRLCAPIEASIAPHRVPLRSREPSARLRLGFVTGDLHRQHPVNLFMLPILERLDHAGFEVCVYCTGGMHDAYTRRARANADRWREAAALDDGALRDAIQADGVDVLVDLAGHTSSHRLGVFAMRAAPVQVTFLGYPHSTGLSAIDWIIGDGIVSPAEDAGLFTEGLAQMPNSVFCWAPVDDHPLPPARPAGAPIVLGSFNNAMKLSPMTIALWADVLRALPGAVLLLKAPSLQDDAARARLAAAFAEHGIGRERLEYRGPSGLHDMMREYGDLDVALDPFPYNGGTTTLQALWMGVPVVTLAGRSFASRMGASFMTTLNHRDWIAADRAAYVDAAARLVGDLKGLRNGRAQLRAQVASSPLGDIATYVKDLQDLLRLMWRARCAGSAPRVLRATA
jgi:predicted O-linked N-acetylglucosamine transferase (SPINDLY family)